MDGYVQRLVMEADTLDELVVKYKIWLKFQVLVFSSGEQEELLRRIGWEYVSETANQFRPSFQTLALLAKSCAL